MVFEWLKNKIPVTTYIKKLTNDDMSIVCAENLVIYYFNTTAAFFLDSVDGKLTVNDIKNKFLKSYDVEERELEKDFIEMIRDLQWKKILILE